ncbi:MAG: hypothetical protein A4E73_00009 [Syntrophaceae bacterium PtaU1.Bin231]|nr:MAG: hypothetical protein A4E73_00009 [Syntrophaceae bacterium PtaU1.Bin231]
MPMDRGIARNPRIGITAKLATSTVAETRLK